MEGKAKAKPGMAYLESETYISKKREREPNEKNKWIWRNKRTPNTQQKRKLVALTLMAAVEAVLENHVYNFNGNYSDK